MKCDRCFKETQGSIMSKFNTQTICFECKDAEQADPEYAAASKSELEAVQAGVKNYPGVGLSFFLREKFVKAMMEERDEFFSNVNWNRFDGGYELADAENNGCTFCKEPIPEMSLNLHDVDEFHNACLKCGVLILEGMAGGVESYLAGIQADITKVVSLLAEGK